MDGCDPAIHAPQTVGRGGSSGDHTLRVTADHITHIATRFRAGVGAVREAGGSGVPGLQRSTKPRTTSTQATRTTPAGSMMAFTSLAYVG